MGAIKILQENKGYVPKLTRHTSNSEYQYRIANDGYRHWEYSHTEAEHTRKQSGEKLALTHTRTSARK